MPALFVSSSNTEEGANFYLVPKVFFCPQSLIFFNKTFTNSNEKFCYYTTDFISGQVLMLSLHTVTCEDSHLHTMDCPSV